MPARKSDQEERMGLGARVAAAVREDPLLYALSGLLLVAMLMATLYGLRYGNVDQSVVKGHVSINVGDAWLATIDVDENKEATINYVGHTMHGKLRLDGADTDSILYAVKDLTFENNLDPKGAVLLVRVPRSGLQGDLSGPWMLYFSYPADGEVEGSTRSDWVYAGADGTALYGYAPDMNAMTAQRKTLEAQSVAWRWTKTADGLSLTN